MAAGAEKFGAFGRVSEKSRESFLCTLSTKSDLVPLHLEATRSLSACSFIFRRSFWIFQSCKHSAGQTFIAVAVPGIRGGKNEFI
jgi:hypothetical protein